MYSWGTCRTSTWILNLLAIYMQFPLTAFNNIPKKNCSVIWLYQFFKTVLLSKRQPVSTNSSLFIWCNHCKILYEKFFFIAYGFKPTTQYFSISIPSDFRGLGNTIFRNQFGIITTSNISHLWVLSKLKNKSNPSKLI